MPVKATGKATLGNNPDLAKLRADLAKKPGLSWPLKQDPAAVLKKYGLTVVLPPGSLELPAPKAVSRVRVGVGGLGSGRGTSLHADAHLDSHVDLNPHIDSNPHIDLG